MADQEERKRRKRATIRTLTTKLLQKIERELAKDEPDNDELEELLSQLAAKEAILSELDEDIERELEDSEDLEIEVEGAQDYQERIIAWKGRAMRKLQRMQAGQTVQRESDRHISGDAPINVSTVKLPPITLEKFCGDPINWQGFWSQYKIAIHENGSLAKAEKFNYLRSYLGGSAANSINGMAMTNDNYDAAISLLSERFGRKDLVINAHMNKLLNLESVKKSSDLEGLRRLYDACEVQVRSLASMGVVTETYGSLLCPILLKMIPEDIALDFSRSRDLDRDWNVMHLLNFIQRELESRERASILTRSVKDTQNTAYANNRPKPKPWQQNLQGYHKANLPSASALNATVEHTCMFCEKADGHKTEDCKELSPQEKRDKIKKLGRCFICLGRGHVARFCRMKHRNCAFCHKRHHTSICNEGKNAVQVGANDSKQAVLTSAFPNNSSFEQETILLQTADALAEGDNKSISVRCLLDGGSQKTFILDKVSRALNLPVIGEDVLNIHTFGSNTPINARLRKVKLKLCNMLDSDKSIEIEAFETPMVCTAMVNVPGRKIREIMELKGLKVADTLNEGVRKDIQLSVLIGADNYWKVVSGRIERLSGDLVALETVFGWCIQGPTNMSSLACETSAVGVMKAIMEEEVTGFQLQKFWDLESLGILNKTDTYSNTEEKALQSFQSSIKFKDDRYEVRLPWKSGKELLNDNFIVAEKRLQYLAKRFKFDPVLYERYDKVITEQINKGIVEQVTVVPDVRETNVTYYLPHHAVIREEKDTTKTRVVFDASSHEKGFSSLNDCLYQGPNLNPDLLRVLLKFRENKVALMADIEKAFLQISLALEDRDVVRFLWMEKPLNDPGSMEIKVLRMTRVVFGVTSSPFLLAATVKHHLKKYETLYSQTCKLLENYLYVDDFISGAETVADAFQISVEAKEILSTASMNLRKWKTNSTELKTKWKTLYMDDDPNNDKSETFNKGKTPLKVLGMSRNSENYVLEFELDLLLKFLMSRKSTKRFVLQASARVFDPVGFLTPFLIRVKCLFQRIWERGIGWDEELPSDLRESWDEWCMELPGLQDVKIPRYHFFRTSNIILKKQLHGFCDASERAYGAVVYIRYVTVTQEIGVSFVTSKSRVAPLKKLTLPRLELMGALIAARLMSYLKDIFVTENTELHLWSDSTIALHWIRGSATRWKPFVANRVEEIQKLTDPQIWSHCKGQDNPADVITRGKHLENLISSNIWWNGPSWLALPESQWPHTSLSENECETEAVQQEKRKNTEITVQVNCEMEMLQTNIIDPHRYSSYRRLIRVTAWIFRFLNNINKGKKRVIGSLSAEELFSSEVYNIHIVQLKAFKTEILELCGGRLTPKDSPIANLNPILDKNGLICVGGRLQESELRFSEKHPWILPPKEKICELIVQDCHERVMHSGVGDTLIQVREKYWIVRGRQTVKLKIKQCLICKRLKAKHGNVETAPLPKDRIMESPPFEVTGIDFAGPLYVKAKKQQNKCYIALFTCAVTRAVHLELVSNLSTECFLLALRRFVSRRGLCRVIYSDNAKTFKRANQDLKEIWNSLKTTRMLNFYGERGITWKYIVERGAWWGGFWERLVRSVKTCLKKILGKASLTFEEMLTTLTEVEAVLNSRPITYTYNEVDEPIPLTPAHFLIGKRLTTLPPQKIDFPKPITSSKGELEGRLKYRQKLMERFWNRWRKEYLLDLRSAHFVGSTKGNVNVKANDVVLVSEDKVPRHMWKLGKIQELFEGRDGKVRACAVKLTNGSVIRRPIQLLYPLEL